MPRRLGLRQHAQRLAIILIIGIQISIRFLDRNDLVDDLFGRLAKCWTISRLQDESRRLGPLINIGIRENRATLGRLALPYQTAKIIHATIGFQQVVHRRNASAHIDLATWPPESSGNAHSSNRDVPQLGMWGFGQVLDRLILPSW